MAQETGLIIGRSLAQGMKTLGQALTVQAAEKRRRTEQEQKEEARRQQAEEKEESKRLRAIEEQAEEALSELSFFESIGDEQAQEALFNFNLARSQAGLPPAPLGQQRLTMVKKRQEAIAEEEQEREQQEQLARGFQAFGKPIEELGAHVPEGVEQQPLDFSGMFTETMGITPSAFETPTGTQEAAGKIQEVINQIGGMRPSEFDEPHELQAVGQTALENIRERALIEAAFAGKKLKTKRRAAGIGVSRADFTPKELKRRYASYVSKVETFNRKAQQTNQKAAALYKDFPALAQAETVEMLELKPYEKWSRDFLSQFEPTALRALEKELMAGQITTEDLSDEELDAVIERLSREK